MNPLARPLLHPRSSAWGVRLLAASCAVTLGGGCLWWPDIDERTEFSLPPVIDRSKVLEPSPDQPVELVSTSTPFSVEGAVSDADTPVEELNYAWFLSYQDTWDKNTGLFRPPAFTGSPFIRLNACYFVEELKPEGSTHLLELFVSDRPIGFDAETGRTFSGGYAYVAWAVKLTVACP